MMMFPSGLKFYTQIRTMAVWHGGCTCTLRDDVTKLELLNKHKLFLISDHLK